MYNFDCPGLIYHLQIWEITTVYLTTTNVGFAESLLAVQCFVATTNHFCITRDEREMLPPNDVTLTFFWKNRSCILDSDSNSKTKGINRFFSHLFSVFILQVSYFRVKIVQKFLLGVKYFSQSRSIGSKDDQSFIRILYEVNILKSAPKTSWHNWHSVVCSSV